MINQCVNKLINQKDSGKQQITLCSYLWSNSPYHKAGTNANIQLPLPPKIVKGNFLGYYALITELGDLRKLDDDDEVEINYLKKSFGKWAVVKNDLDSRMICELTYIDSTIDGRSRYTIKE